MAHSSLASYYLFCAFQLRRSPATRMSTNQPSNNSTLLPALTFLSLSRVILFSELNTRGRPIWQSTTRDIGRRRSESRQPEPDAVPTVSRSEASIPDSGQLPGLTTRPSTTLRQTMPCYSSLSHGAWHRLHRVWSFWTSLSAPQNVRALFFISNTRSNPFQGS
jgi:hypothetical protein